jgi:phage terminase small subunit
MNEKELDIEIEALNNKKEKALTGKQEKFCREYILCLNKGKAYSIAYGLPYETTADIRKCSSMGCRLYENARIHARIEEMVEQANKKCDVTLEFIIKEQLEALARMKIGKKEKKLDIEGNVVDTGEIEIDNKAINMAIKNLADFTGLTKQRIEAMVNADAKVDAKVSTAKDIARAIVGDDN